MQNPDLPMLFRHQQHQANGDQNQPKNHQSSQKTHKENALNRLSESETIDKSQTASQKKSTQDNY